jgi:hypothetical protein
MKLDSSVRDLEIAARAADAMARATQYPDFLEHWQVFLMRIERAWEYAARTLQKERGFQQWFKPYTQQKRSDPLLVYLEQARHAETHAVAMTMQKPMVLSFRDRLDRPFAVDSVTANIKDGVLTIAVETAGPDKLLSYEANLVPVDPILMRFKNRDKWYEPPQCHLGQRHARLHPVEAAQLGLAFYRGFIEEAKYKFGEQSKGR